MVNVIEEAQREQKGIARLFGSAIFYSLLVLIFLVAIPYGTVEPWWEALFECAVFALAVLWAIEGLISGEGWFNNRHAIFLPLLALILFAFFQSLHLWGGLSGAAQAAMPRAISADPFETQRAAFKLLALMLAGVMLLRYTNTRSRLSTLVYTVIGVGLFSAIFGLVRQVVQTEDVGFLLPYLRRKEGYGQFINRNHFAYLMEMSFGLTLGLVLGRGVKRERVLIHFVPALLIWTALVLSNSRGGLFSMMAQVIVMMLLLGFKRTHRGRLKEGQRSAATKLEQLLRSRPLRAGLVALLIGVLFVGALWVGGESLTGRLESVQSEIEAPVAGEQDGARRGVIWAATWKMFKEHPLAGVGLGAYWIAITRFHQAPGSVMPRQAHNDYLELLVCGGIIGLALGLWFAFSFIRRVRHALQAIEPFKSAASLGAVVGIAGVAVHSLGDFGLHITINALVFMALMVISVAEINSAVASSLTDKH